VWFATCSFDPRWYCSSHETELAAARQPGATIMRNLKLFSLAFAVAATAFVFALVNNPPQSVASDPVKGMSAADFKVPAGLSNTSYDAF
jgi:hypothetical protein